MIFIFFFIFFSLVGDKVDKGQGEKWRGGMEGRCEMSKTWGDTESGIQIQVGLEHTHIHIFSSS